MLKANAKEAVIMTLGQRIQELRKGMGFSQEELGQNLFSISWRTA